MARQGKQMPGWNCAMHNTSPEKQRPRDSLSKVATTICGHLPQYGEDNWRFSAALPPLSGGNSLPQPDIPGDGRSTDEQEIIATMDTLVQHIPTLIIQSGAYRSARGWSHSFPVRKNNPSHDEMQTLILTGNPTLFGDGQYLSFSFMRRHMIDKVPEPFRTGMESSKLWKEEQESGGLPR
ncbi:hypothetical protein TEQG_02544 [Trichophyton equinum CBS 127.97]|uniref:Uncharacterized protein n=1 Tax=Trichophyton equinum (strain ATCC MYA-4606 / CBS 127.97) TaxID=559882 RepID=F2PNP6_TRIEC|nr:hypothetical protein TEQG_02544 [Trichophyton equinum CBS 127.97]